MRASLPEEIAAVRALCRDLDLGDVAPAVLKAAHHTTFHVAPLAMVARVQSAEPIDPARQRAIREIAVTRYLSRRGAPAVMPFDGFAGPYVSGPSVVTFWHHMPYRRAADERDAALAASALATLHAAMLGYEGELPSYTDGLDRCWRVLAQDDRALALVGNDRDILRSEYRRLRRDVETATDVWTPLHGDAHLGNLLLGERGPVWADFEDTCRGPREYDIACLPANTWTSFPDADQALVQTCSMLKSVCVAVWCAADPSRSDPVREAAAYHLARVRDAAR